MDEEDIDAPAIAERSGKQAQLYDYDSEDDSSLENEVEGIDDVAAEDEVAAAADENYFPRIVAVFYSIFHPTKGPSVIYQVPEGSIEASQQPDNLANEDIHKGEIGERSGSVPSISHEPAFLSMGKAAAPQQHEALFDFKNLSEYIIPRAPLCGRLITYSTTSERGESYKILSHPMLLTDQAKYPRNTFIFNLAFVFDGRADVRAYEPIVRKCARELRDLEENVSFLSKSQFRMYGIIEQLFEDLNSYYESFVALPDVPHSKYITEAAKTAELLRESKRASAPKVWQDAPNGSIPGPPPQRTLSQSSSTSADRSLRMTALTSAAATPIRDRASPPSLTPLDLDDTADRGYVVSQASPVSPKAIRPSANRSNTEATIVQSPSTSSQSTTVSPSIDTDVKDPQTPRKDSSGSSVNASHLSRPMINRAKTFAALGLSGTTVSASNTQGTLAAEVPSSEQNRSTPTRAVFASRSSSAEGSTSERELNQSIASLRAIDERKTDEGAVASTSNTSPLRKASGEQSYLDAVPPQQTIAPGAREPPHGLGRRVRDALNVKLFPTYTNPKDVNDWDVPVMLLDLDRRTSDNWDLTMRKILPFVDGINHVKRIAQLADADLELTRQCIEHLLYYRCIIMIDAFQFSNLYTVRPTIATLADDEIIVGECATYVTRGGHAMPTWPKLLSLYSSLRPSLSLNDWIEENDVDSLGIDVRRFVTFGVIKGFLRRVHRYPILLLGEAGAQLERKSNISLGTEFGSSTTKQKDRSVSPRIDSPVTTGAIERAATSEELPRLQSNTSLHVDDTTSLTDRYVSPERELTSPRRRRAERQETSDDYAWMGAVYSSTAREGSILHSRSGRDGLKASSMRRRGLPHAPSAQLAHQHRPKQATVMDVANVAFEAAAKEMDSDRAYQSRAGMRTKTFNLRSPLPRGQSGSTARGSLTIGSRRDGYTDEDLRTMSSSNGGKMSVPEGLIEMLDGTCPDDAFCVQFSRSWNEMMQLLVFVGVTLPALSRNAAQAGQSGLTIRRGAGGGRSSIDIRSAADVSGIETPIGGGGGGGDESGFPQMSGIWGVPGLPGRKSSVQGGATPSSQNPSKNVTFPSLPRYRQQSQGYEDNGSAFEKSGFNRYAQAGSAFSQKQGGSANAGANTIDEERTNNVNSNTQKQGSASMASSKEGASFLLPLPEEFGYHERQRILNGDLGRIQIIIK